jgi:HPt (histidine-containing phosphotransfer) domain-containing protein
VREPDLSLLDEAVLGELASSLGGDVSFVIELIEAYLADAPQQISEIRHAATAADAAEMVRPAHTLKSSSATVGAQRLAARARRLELGSRAGQVQELADDVAGLAGEWDATAAALRSWMSRAG